LDGLATVDDDLDVPEAAHVDEHVSGSQPVVARHSGQLPVQRPITGNTPVSAQSAVEAELNRLAYLPDQEEPLGPVEVPTIAAASQPAAPVAAVPALSQHEMYSPRQSAPVVHSRTSFLDLAANSYAPPPRRRKRHVFRNVVTFVVLLGLVGGGLFAAKYYLLDKRWDGQLKDLAGNVERQRELTFDHAVPVTTLPVEAFATKIATLSLGVTADNSQALTAEWRAFGLLSGPLDVRAIGLNAMPESPAYYDPASETIYVLEGLDTPVDGKRPAIYDFAMQRALTLALLDQTYGWGDRIAGMSPAVANGTRALYDADALATADAMTTPEARPQVYAQILEMYSKYGIPTSPSPYASVVTGWLGVALVPYLQSVPVANRPAVLKDRLISDGQALDIRRLVTGGNENAAGSRGMLFWYHTLASRVDADTAWKAALAWRRDTVTSTVDSVNRVCQVAVISVDLAELDRVDRAFQQWAKGAPSIAPAQVASVALATEGQVSISVCDPSNPGSVDTDPQPSLGGAPLRAEQFRLLLIAQSTLPVAQAACAVFGSDDITVADDRGVIDAVVGWQAPVNHPAPDPNRLGCVPAA
jgi:DNA-binding transcriptional regulator YdaS (Cro superfamily)